MVTLATLKDATKQEIFNQVVEHCLRQSVQCKENGYCKYFSDSYKCAAGCLISPEEYTKSFECNDWEQLVNSELVPDFHADLIFALQNVHDNSEVKDWQTGFYNVATEFDLDSTVVDNFTFMIKNGKECYRFNG